MRKNVLATLAYYDVLDFPLKAEEVLRYLIRFEKRPEKTENKDWKQEEDKDRKLGNVALEDNEVLEVLENEVKTLSFYHDRGNLIVKEKEQTQTPTPTSAAITEIKKSLDWLVLDKLVDFDSGYYFLFGRDYLVPLRIKREKISRRKWRKALKTIRWLKFIPYVEAVFASGSLALGNCDELSDLDVLVVTKHGRIWLTRFWITAWLSFIGRRRKPSDKIAPDKICLNHYITDKSLKIPFESIYNAQNYVNLKPLLVRDPRIVKDFFEANAWIKKYLYQSQSYDISLYHSFSNIFSRALAFVLNSKLGDWLEKVAKRYQIKKIVRNPLTQSQTGHVVYTDEQLAFHPDSPEKSVLERYEQNLNHHSLCSRLSRR